MERCTYDQIADEAGAWDARLRAPDCTDDDRARFAEWRESNLEHRLAFEKVQAIVATFRNNLGRADIRALRDAALRADKPHRSQKRTLAVAAIIAALAITATVWATLSGRALHAPLEQLIALTDTLLADTLLGRGRPGIYETGVGQRSTVTLQDGSSVELNSKSRIKVAFSETTRNVELISGQAVFHVAKNPQRPFIVRAADRDITAVGTAFDVRLDAKSVRVTLLEGKVRVTKESYLERSEGGAGAPSLPSAAQREALSKDRKSKENVRASTQPESQQQSGLTTALSAATSRTAGRDPVRSTQEQGEGSNEFYLTPGQQFVAHLAIARERNSYSVPSQAAHSVESAGSIRTQNAVVRSVDVSKVIGWRDGRVFLEDLTLADAVAEMNKYSDLQIRVADPQVAELRVNGMFRAGEQGGFIAALEEYFPIAAQRESDTEIILAKRR